MKKQIDLQLMAIFGGGLLFNYLFWMERLALNLLIYSVFIIIMLVLDKNIEKSKKLFLFCFSHLLAAILVVYNQSALTVISYYISLIVFIGFAHAQLLRGICTSLLSGFLQILSSPINLISKLINLKIGNFSMKPILKPIKYIIIPTIVIIFFSVIYSIANPVFGDYAEAFFTNVGDLLNNIFTFFFGELSFARFMHVILGILFTAGLLLSFKSNWIQKQELTLTESLIRKRKNRFLPDFIYEIRDVFIGQLTKKKMALKTENIIGIISFTALNLLLLFLNAIDITTLWLGNLNNLGDKNYSAELHEGTNALIVSIFMAMAVILYFFNGNLNFFSKNKTIKTLAFLWIAQNAFLVCSVMLRDYNYIVIQGLTYKRIGVVIFLILCSIGLITVYLKVSKQKTVFYLCKINSLAWYILLLVFGFVNWDVFIVDYNIEHRKSIALDLDHLMEMSDKTLPLLDKNRAILRDYVAQSNYANIVETEVTVDSVSASPTSVKDTIAVTKPTPLEIAQAALAKKQKAVAYFDDDIDDRVERFKEKWDSTTWLSWNFRDWQTHEYFKNKK